MKMILKLNVQRALAIFLHLTEVAKELTSRLLHIFEKNEHNERLVNGPYNWFYQRRRKPGPCFISRIFSWRYLCGDSAPAIKQDGQHLL